MLTKNEQINGKSGIYIIRNTQNGKFYLGSSVNHLQRTSRHSRDLIRNKHDNSHLQRAWNKYGKPVFIMELLYELPVDVLKLAENHLLDKYCGTNMCYNINKSADRPALGRKWTDIQRITQSERLRGRILTEDEKYTLLHPLVKKTEEERITSRLCNIAKATATVAALPIKQYKEHLIKRGNAISKSKIGGAVSSETKKKISASLKDKPWSDARRSSQNNRHK